ncbi:MAG: response regulator RpfG family c-di-GMP phosphodiesterase [Flavobacterium sp.]
MLKLYVIKLSQKIHENEDIRLKTIPYLFITTIAEQDAVIDAYSKSIQGFFIKPSSFQDLKSVLKTVVDYWQKCKSLNYTK